MTSERVPYRIEPAGCRHADERIVTRRGRS